MTRRTSVLVAWAVLGALSSLTWAQAAPETQAAPGAASPQVLLEKGIYTEETVGDLDAAIQIYKQILADAQANRTYAAQAQYRLAMCYLKKGDKASAIQELRRLLTSYPQEKDVVGQAQTELAKLTAMRPLEFGPVVEKVLPARPLRESELLDLDTGRFLTGSDFGADDRQTHAWIRQEGLDVMGVIEKGQYGALAYDMSALPVSPDLWDKLTADALRANQQLSQMEPTKITPLSPTDTKYEPETYLFRTREGGHGILQILGLSQEPEGVKIRYKLLQEGQAEWPPRLPAEVMEQIFQAHLTAYGKAQEQHLFVNTHIYGVDDQFNRYFGGLLTHKNASGQAESGPIHLGNFSERFDDFLVDEQGRPQEYGIREEAFNKIGKYSLWWKPDQPVQPGELRILGYTGKDVQKLPQTDGKAQLTMDNHFGSPVLESFFLVTPLNLAIALATAEPVSKQNIGAYTVYLWQERVPADTTHRVDVVLERSQPTTLVLRERHFVKLVLGKERMTFQGNDVTWEGLPGLLEEVPNRSETVLEVALADEAVPGKLLMDALNLATKYGFEYGSYVGQAQLGAKGEASVTVETLGASPQETPEATEAVKAAEQLKSVAQAFLQAVAAGEDETAAGLCAPGTVKTSEFAKLREYYDLSQARIVQANDRQGNAYAVTNFFPSKEGKKATAMGIGMRKQGDRWLIRDIDALPDEPSLAAYIESFNKAFPPAEPVARAWVGMIDAGQYDTAWDEAAEMLRNAIPKATFVEQTKAVRAPLGKVESRSTRSVSYTNSLPGAPDGQYAVIQFQTSFENKKQAVETVTPMKGEDGKWRVSGYYIK